MKAKNKLISFLQGIRFSTTCPPPSSQSSGWSKSDFLICLMIGVLCFFHLLRIWDSSVAYDDWEHLASAWFVYNGYEPYRDFFQHHNPLWWYLLAPLFYFLKEPYDSFYIARILTLAFVGGSIFLIAKIIKRLQYNSHVFLYTLYIYLAYPITCLYHIQQRPDTPMVFFLLGGFYLWIRFITDKQKHNLIACYFSFFLAFMFLQKALIFILPFGIYQLWLLYRKKLEGRLFLQAICLPCILFTGYIGYLLYQGAFIRYLETNYLLQTHIFRDYHAYYTTICDIVFYLAGTLALIVALFKTSGWKKQLIIVLGSGLLIWLYLPKPYSYYYTPWIIISAVMISIGIRNWSPTARLLFLLPAFIFAVLAFHISPSINVYTLSDIKLLRAEIKPQDSLLTYNSTYLALFKPKPEHYYWHFLHSIAQWDDQLFHYTEIPQWNEIIRREKPKYILSRRILSLHHSYPPKDVVMETDTDFLGEYYTRLPTKLPIWKLKE